jgi:hypothetical protein
MSFWDGLLDSRDVACPDFLWSQIADVFGLIDTPSRNLAVKTEEYHGTLSYGRLCTDKIQIGHSLLPRFKPDIF